MKKIFLVLLTCLNSQISNGVIGINFVNNSGYDGNLDPEGQFIVQLVYNPIGIDTSIDWGLLSAVGDTIIASHITLAGMGGTFPSLGVFEFTPPTNSGVIFIRVFRYDPSASYVGSAWVVESYPFTEYNSLIASTIYSTDGIIDSPFYLGTSGIPIVHLGFELEPYYYLTLQVIGSGTITGATSGERYDSADEISLSAVADEGWLFTGWSGSISRGYAESNTVITIDSDKVIIATFSEDADNDSLSNIQEAEVGTNPRYSESLIELYNLVSNKVTMAEAQAAMRDLRVGSQTFDISNGNAKIRMFVDESSDLTSTWSNTQHVLELDIPADADTKFYRFRMD